MMAHVGVYLLLANFNSCDNIIDLLILFKIYIKIKQTNGFIIWNEFYYIKPRHGYVLLSSYCDG